MHVFSVEKWRALEIWDNGQYVSLTLTIGLGLRSCDIGMEDDLKKASVYGISTLKSACSYGY